ncbi:hypothetical protein SUGI_0396820 [Cryptomeria japonica]|uniref:uncharacterized protein LOC131074655 n=1 Tax=Cryptomeria japonica TaxID=3369 RepID=UPI002408B113|nr:uncharacterized protein LOC131074655 [Cryptomeria japonica]XP_057867300.2 uncharacterized protein LOC131074655 [Cryptomeria japonica]XP_059075822.1 uncharacterized protein LOC131074655 [Cryptomeria japonica]GLJ21490.1 hypothetical protein SUGI_0396820 [Cryptomeria japonica]
MMGHTHLDNNSGNSYKKLTVKGDNLKECPTDIVSECNVDDHYFKCSCENASSKVMHSKTDDEYFLELRRTSVYHSSSSHRKFWQGASKGPKGEGKLDSGSNSISEKDLDVLNCSQRHAMSHIREQQKGENDDLVSEESSTMYLNSMVKDKKLETEDLIHNMSNLPHYLQQTEKGESFQERALRFGVLDWSLLEKWNRNRGRGQRSFHSPSGSDTSSSFSTLGSSSFSCRSDHSSSAKREMSPSSSLHTYLNSSSVSSTNLHGLSYLSSPTNGQERYPSCVEGSRHGSKQSFPNAQIKTDCEGKHYEYLDLKLLQRKVVDSQGSKVDVPNDICSLENKLSYSGHKAPNQACFSGSAMRSDSGINGSKTEQSSNFVFELPKEQWVSGPATPGFFSARDRSPETCSEVSLNLEDVSLKTGENSRSLGITGSNQVASLEDDINIHFVDCLEELPAAHADEGNIWTEDPSCRGKFAAYPHDLSPQKVDPNISVSPECERNSICLDDYGRIFQDPQESILAKSFVCPVDSKLRDISRNSIHLRTDANDVSFRKSQSAIRNELQPRNKDADVPVKIAAAFSDQHLPETVVTNEFPVVASRNYKNRRAKSFSLNGSTDRAINDHLTAFMTPKSFSVRSATCSSDCTLSKDGCKGCKKSAVSPLRRWIDPIVKSRERHPIDVSSCTFLQSNSLHHDHGADVLNSKGGIGANKSLRKSLAQGFSRASHITLRNSSVRSISSDCQAFIASENDISGKHSLHISRSRCSSPRPKHEKISEKLSQSALETGISCSSMSAPPAHPPILQGLLHFKYKSGFPYFTFSRNESDEILAAKTWKDNSEGRDFDWMYSFHSGKSTDKKRNKSGWGNWGRKDNHIPDLVANMKVSSSLCSKLNGHGNVEHIVETEFVLFGSKKGNINSNPIVRTEYTENSSFSPSQVGHPEVSSDMPLSNSSPVSTTSSTSMPGDTMESILPRDLVHLDRKTEMHALGYPSRQNFREPCQSNSMRSRSEGRNTIQATHTESNILNSNVILSSPFSPDLELAALVIKVPLEWRGSVKGGQGEDAASNEFGGWGLKFLAKNLGGSSTDTYFDYPMNLPPEFDDYSHCHSLKSSVSPMEFGNISTENSCLNSERCSFEYGSSESSDIHSSCGAQGHTGVTVIIPAGIHSQPSTNSGGPSPLIERWRSGGSCDCGGWDLGCPLTILENQNPNKNSSSERIVRANQGTLALSLDVVHDGLYLLRFHPQLSALQAFSIGVATLHSREPLMFSKEAQIERPCCRSSHPPRAKQGKTLSQAISTPEDDIPLSMPNNHDIFFASRVSDPPLSPFGRV